MENLKEVGIGGTQIPGLGSLANLKNLKSLRIVDQASTELSPLGTLTNLEYLWIWGPTQLNALPLHNQVGFALYRLWGWGSADSLP